MNIEIGNRIKEFRKAKGMTQEQLADAIGISFQAVSKWENNIALPDITLVPVIARIFGVTTDDLFAHNLKEMQEEIKKIAYESYLYREDDPQKAKKILTDGLIKYPENDILLNNLLYVTVDPDDSIKIATKLIDKTSESEIKYDALRFLAYAYNKKGDSEAALSALEQIPELYFTKLSEIAFILDGKPKFEAAEKQKWISFETMIQMMSKLSECYESENKIEKAIAEYKRAKLLIDSLAGEEKIENFGNYYDYFSKQIEKLESK